MSILHHKTVNCIVFKIFVFSK